MTVISLRFPFTKKHTLDVSRFFSKEFGTSLLYSGGNFDSSLKSFLFLFPYEQIIVESTKQIHIVGQEVGRVFHNPNPWDGLKDLWPSLNCQKVHPEWVGYLAYELGAYSDKDKILELHSLDIPKAHFLRCGLIISVNHTSQTASIYSTIDSAKSLNEMQREWILKLLEENFWSQFLEQIAIQTADDALNKPLSIKEGFDSEKEYTEKINVAKELISSGDVYQINLSQQIILEGKRDPFEVFYGLTQINPSPFSAFLNFDKFNIVSSSPERFLSKSNQEFETRPIKGTASRGGTDAEDTVIRDGLLNSVKEKAELLMITDLMRNDLARISQAGTVVTNKIWECEAYANVFHLLSVIKCKSLPDLHPLDAIRACFPGGSITGCPKLNAMEFIHKIENRPRGIYTGSIGYLAGNGDFDFNIAIRTILMKENEINIQLGGGIIFDSNPHDEYNETFHKGKSIFQVLGLEDKEKI